MPLNTVTVNTGDVPLRTRGETSESVFGLEIGYSGMLDTRVRRVVGPGLCPTVRGTATVCNGSSESSARVFLSLARTFMSLP